MNDSERNWLIKSSTRILGPFTLTELTEQLRSRHISIIDEIRQPDGRWSYIRENKLFLDVVKNIREEQDAQPDSTMTQSIAQHTSMTRTDAINVSEESTTTPVHANFDLTPPPAARENIKDVTPPMSSTGVRTFPAGGATKNYGTANDFRVQGRLQKKSSFWRWWITATTLAVVGFVAITLVNKDRKRSLGAEELMAQAIRYKTLGLYEKSLNYYLKATKIKAPNFESQVQMAPVLISEDRQSLVGRRILTRALLKEDRGRTGIVEAYLSIAVSYIMDGDLKQAEDTLQKAIGYEPFNMSALLNLGIIHLKKGNYEEAMRDFDKIYRKNPQSSIALFGHSLAAVEYSKLKDDPTVLQALIRDMKVNLQKTYYLRQELLLFYVYAFNLLDDVDGMNQAVVQFLSQMPGQAKNFVRPLQVEWRFTQWDYLEKYCAEIYAKQSPNPELKALRAVCLMEVNRDLEAAKLLQESLDEAPKDPYVLVTQASYLAKIGRYPEAMTILKMPELANMQIKNFLVGDICIKTQDLNCVQGAYSELYGQDPINAVTLYGLAWRARYGSDRAKAFDYVNAGMQAESRYLPLLELRDQLESE